MSIGNAVYKVEADTGSAIKNISDLIKITNSMIGGFSSADLKLKEFEKSISSLGNRVTESGRVVNAFGTENKKLTEELKKLKTQAEIARSKGIRQLANEQSKATPQVNKLTKSLRLQKGAMQQVGFQVQDFAVQIAGGTSAVVAFGQQGSQLAGIFGPGGAVAGALIAVGALIGTVFSSGSDEAQESIDELIEKIEELGDKERELLKIRIESEITKAYAAVGEAGIQVKVLSNSLEEAKKRSKDLATESNLLKSVLNSAFGESEAENVKELTVNILEQQATIEKLRRRIEELNKSKGELNDTDRKAAKAATDAKDSYVDLSESLAAQIAIVGKNEREQAKIAAAIKLGSGATEEQTNSVYALIDSYFDLKSASDQYTKAQEKTKREAEKTASAIESLSKQLDVAKLSSKNASREAFQLAAEQKLGSNATREQAIETRALAGELYDLTKAQDAAKKAEMDKQQAIANLGAADPIFTVDIQRDNSLANLQAQLDAELITEQTYADRKVEINRNAELQIQQISEERFRAQSEANDFLIGSLDALASTAASSMGALITGGATATEVINSLASTVLNQAIGALIELGLQQVKNQIIGQTAAASAAAASAATGTAMAAAYAPAAALASLASFGANAAPASAGIASTVGLASGLAATGLERGGVLGGGLTEMGEGNSPEVLKTDNGIFAVPGSRGRVFNQEQLSQIGGGGVKVSNIINNYASSATVDSQVKTQEDGSIIIETIVADIRTGNGPVSSAMNQAYPALTRKTK